MRIPGLGGWGEDPLWAGVYDWTVEHPGAGALLWRVGIGSDLRLLYAATAEVGRLPAGAKVLDVPSGGGVALRGLRSGQGLAYVAADISGAMLGRTRDAARGRDVQDQVFPVLADVGALPFPEAAFDLVATFTGLHCFPDPRLAVSEMVRALRPGGVLTGSALFDDTGLRYEPIRVLGRAAGLIGPGVETAALTGWLEEEGLGGVTMRTSGAIGYFRGVKR